MDRFNWVPSRDLANGAAVIVGQFEAVREEPISGSLAARNAMERNVIQADLGRHEGNVTRTRGVVGWRERTRRYQARMVPGVTMVVTRLRIR